MSFTRFRERSRDVQDGVERHTFGKVEYTKAGAIMRKAKGTDTEDDESPMIIGTASFNLPKDHNSEIFMHASSSDTTLKMTVMAIPRDKQRRWMEGAGGVQHPTD